MDEDSNRSSHGFTNIKISGDARAHLGNSYTLSKEETQLHFFKTSNYEAHKNFNPERVSDTCKWFLEHKTYLRWQDSDRDDLLWLSADPGCGKSVLSRALIDERLVGRESLICYFFFKDNEEQNSVSTAMCALLHQLFCSKGALLKKHASPAIEKNGERLKVEVEELWRLLVAAATDPGAENVICILDALDECKQDQRNKLIRMLEKFYNESAGNSRIGSSLKFVVTSRPYQEIELPFSALTRDTPTIRLAGEEESEDISREINVVITARIKEIGKDRGLSEAVQSCLNQRLLEVTNRTYLWLTLIWDEIRNAISRTEKKLLKVIEELPYTVDEAYEKLLAKCIKREDARKVLQIVLAAERPLTLLEIDVALEIQRKSRSYRDLDLEGEENRKAQIRNLCGLFVCVVDSKIYLIHQTAKEFLMKRTNKKPGQGWKHSVDLQSSHRLLADICIRHLLFEEFGNNPLLSFRRKRISMRLEREEREEPEGLHEVDEVDEMDDTDEEEDLYEFMKIHAFLDYSATYWIDHFREASESGSTKLTHLASELFERDGVDLPTWLKLFCLVTNYKGYYIGIIGCSPSGERTLYFAAAEGLKDLAQLMLKRGVDVNTQGGVYGSALQEAISNGHTEMVKLLIQANADVNAQNGRALQAAAGQNDNEVVELLLQANADVNAQGGYYGNALQAAAVSGNKAGVQLLLQANADVNAPSGYCGENERLVQLLLQAGADVHAQSEFWRSTLGQTRAGQALYVAVSYQYEKAVEVLLQNGADVNARNELQNGADVNARNEGGFTALHTAVVCKSQRIVQLLLQAKADVNIRCKVYSEKCGRFITVDALLIAVEYNRDGMVKTLLHWGAAANPDSYCEALQAAKAYGYKDIVERLENWIRRSLPEQQRLDVKRTAGSCGEVRLAKRTTRQWLEFILQPPSDD